MAAAQVADLSQWTHLSAKTIESSLAYMTSDYANAGAVVDLGASPSLTIQSVLTANPLEHDIATYEGLLTTSTFFGVSLW